MKPTANSKQPGAEAGFEDLPSAFAEFNDIFVDGKELDYYFDSYSQSSIHYEMLNDKVRTRAYQAAILQNKQLFKGKVVLDIGCGTGILSMFAAAAGASLVIGIEMAHIYTVAEQNVKRNGFADKIVILNGKVEEVVLPVDKVDVIISEWMGYFLFFEGMFDSVIFARDKYLKAGGLLFPDKALVYGAGVYDPHFEASRRHYWQNFPGLSMPELDQVTTLCGVVQRVPEAKVVTSSALLAEIDLETCAIADLDFKAKMTLTSLRKDFLNGMVVWFDTPFTHGSEVVNLTTSPFATTTHWKQGLVFFNSSFPLSKADELEGNFWMRKSEQNHRNLEMKVELELKKAGGNFKVEEFYLCG